MAFYAEAIFHHSQFPEGKYRNWIANAANVNKLLRLLRLRNYANTSLSTAPLWLRHFERLTGCLPNQRQHSSWPGSSYFSIRIRNMHAIEP
jgi:hypothetical protein